MKRLDLLAWSLLLVSVLSCSRTSSAPPSEQQSASPREDADPEKNLEALNDAAFTKLNAVMRWLAENDPRRKGTPPDELVQMDKEFRDELRKDLAAADTKDKRLEVLERNLGLVIYVINDNLDAAVGMGLSPPPPVPVTIDALRTGLRTK